MAYASPAGPPRALRRRCAPALIALLLSVPAARVQPAEQPSEMVLIQEITASGSGTVDFTAGITSAFKIYVVEYWGVLPETNATYLTLRFYSGGAWQADAADYSFSGEMTYSNGTTNNFMGAGGTGQTGNSTSIPLQYSGAAQGNSANYHAAGMVKIYDPSNTSIYKRVRYVGAYVNSSGNLTQVDGEGNFYGAAAVTGFRFLYSSGNISVGTFRLYGLR